MDPPLIPLQAAEVDGRVGSFFGKDSNANASGIAFGLFPFLASLVPLYLVETMIMFFCND